MDWDNVRTPVAAKATPKPRPDRVRVLWRVQAPAHLDVPTRRVWECVLFRVETGLELRVQPEGDTDPTPVQTQLLRSDDSEIAIMADAWLAAVLAKGFAQVP